MPPPTGVGIVQIGAAETSEQRVGPSKNVNGADQDVEAAEDEDNHVDESRQGAGPMRHAGEVGPGKDDGEDNLGGSVNEKMRISIYVELTCQKNGHW